MKQTYPINPIWYIASLLTAATMLFSSCANAPDPNARLRIALITTYKHSAYWERVRESAEAKAAQLGNIDLTYLAPEDPLSVVDTQIRFVEQCVYEGYDGIILAAADKDALVKPIKAAKDAGIPVIMIDTGVSKPVYDVLLATNNVQAGEISARLMAQSIGGAGEIAIVNFSDTVLAALRREYGFVREIAENWPDIRIVGVTYCNSDAEKAALQTEEFIKDYAGLSGIWAANGAVVRGVVKGVASLKRTDDITVVGFDDIEELKSMLESGAVKAAVVQNPGVMGADSLQAAADIIGGHPPPNRDIDTGVTVVTRDTINDAAVTSIWGR